MLTVRPNELNIKTLGYKKTVAFTLFLNEIYQYFQFIDQTNHQINQTTLKKLV